MPQPDEFSDNELALLDAVRTLYDIVIGAGATTYAQADGLLEMHQQRWEHRGRPKAATMLALIRRLATDPDAEKRRAVVEMLRMAKPKGSG
jgi:hypothetical protein